MNENVYGLTIDIDPAGTPSGSDATLTYQIGISEDCAQLVERLTDAPGVEDDADLRHRQHVGQ